MIAPLLEQKALPHSEESERAVLAAILLDPTRHLPTTSGRLRPNDFYLERHQRLYEAMLALQDDKVEIDIRTLQAHLEQKKLFQEVGGLAYIATLEVDLPDLGRVEHYVEIVKERSLRRRLIAACSDIYRNCQDGGLDAKQALDRAEQAILELGEQATPRGFITLGEAIKGTVFDLEERPDQLLTGLPSGFDDFDALSHGLNAGSLIIIAGRPGMGKCLSREAEIVEADGSIRTIEEIVRRRTATLLTLSEDHQLGWTSPSAFVDNGTKPVFEVTTRLGRRIKVTSTHPLLTLTGWKRLADLPVGTAIAVPRRIDVFGNEPLGEHRARLLGYLLGDGGLTGTGPSFTNSNPSLLEDFRDAVRRFGGVRVTETKRNPRVSTLSVVADEAVKREARSRFAVSLERALAEYGRPARHLAATIGANPSSITAWRQGRCVRSSAAAGALALVLDEVSVPAAARRNTSNALTSWLRDLGLMGCGARQKFVPEVVFRAPRQEVSAFLNRLFATDGWITTLSSAQVQAGFCSASERLARQVQHLLLRFGVIASIRHRRVRYRNGDREAWQLNITDAASISVLVEEIGIYGKEARVRRALDSLDTHRRHANRDLIPAAVWTIIDQERGQMSWADLARGLGLSHGWNFHRGKRGVSRKRLHRIAGVLNSQRLLRLAESDVYWDCIAEVRHAGDEQVYDLTIPETHNFVANDICVHNSSFSTNVAQSLALKHNKSIGIFSLEMSVQEIAMRILASEAEVPLRKRRPSDRDWDRIHRAARRIADARIFIDDSASPTLLEVASKARRLKLERGLDLLILDYLQLMQAGGRYENRNLEIGAITRGLKGLAKELAIPVIALSQLSRQPERRGSDHRPQLADLRESGCLSGETLVPLADSGVRIPIRDLAGRCEFPIWALNQETLKIGRSNVSRAFATGLKPVFRLTTRLGRVVRATANHKFLTIAGWKRLDQLRPGVHVALPRHLPTSPLPSQTLSNAEVALLGHLIGDGCTLPRHTIQYTTREEDLARTVADLATTIFGPDVRPRINRERRWLQVYLTSTRHHTHGSRSAVAEWLESLGIWGLRSYEKFVPERVFEQPRDTIGRFLRHLWSTDGCIRSTRNGYPAIYYATSSQRLARDVQTLLLKVGVQARLEVHPQGLKGRDQFHVRVSGRSEVLRFAEAVGTVGDYKAACLADVVKWLEARPENTNRDVIPKDVWEMHVRPAMARGGVTHRTLHAQIGTAYAGMTIFKQNLSRERAERVAHASGSEELNVLAASDIYWDRIASVQEAGIEEVFDLTVPGPHNFIANDIFVHNSIEQDADLVAFIYRDEVYNPEVEESHGTAELIVAKNRNGQTGVVDLAFFGETTTFRSRAYQSPP